MTALLQTRVLLRATRLAIQQTPLIGLKRHEDRQCLPWNMVDVRQIPKGRLKHWFHELLGILMRLSNWVVVVVTRRSEGEGRNGVVVA